MTTLVLLIVVGLVCFVIGVAIGAAMMAIASAAGLEPPTPEREVPRS